MKRKLFVAFFVLLAVTLLAMGTTALADQTAWLNQRMATRTGPGTKYDEPGTFFSGGWNGVQVRVLSRSDNKTWALVEFSYNGGLMRAYTGFKRLDGVRPENVGTETVLGTGYTEGSVTAYYGPGPNYLRMKHDVPGNVSCDVIMEENGYLLVDYPYYTGETERSRSWIPAGQLYGYAGGGAAYYDPYGGAPAYEPPVSSEPSYVRYGQSWWDEEPEWSYADLSYVDGNEISVYLFFYRIAYVYGTITPDWGDNPNHGTFVGYFSERPEALFTGEVWFFDGGWMLDMHL